MPRTWPLSVTARDLATEWVIKSIPPMTKEDLRDCQEIMTEMFRRVGHEHTDKYIEEARAAYRMLVP